MSYDNKKKNIKFSHQQQYDVLEFSHFSTIFLCIQLFFFVILQFGLRHKRQYGADLYLPESFIIPGGDGDASEWGAWSSPSECSRTCGGGVAYQSRECLKVGQNGEYNCQGGDKKYFSCNTQDCSESLPDFRQQQCSNFDRTPFEGVQYNWVPYTKAPNPCELNCMPRGERFYFRHRSKVVDGTRCNDASVDVCVDGTCQVNIILFYFFLFTIPTIYSTNRTENNKSLFTKF